MPLLDQTIAEAVARDGLPRVVTADDASVHVLYLERNQVRSILATDWPPPLPTDPTPAQIAAAIAARAAQVQQDATDAAQLRAQVVTIAQSAVGVVVTNLDGAQVRALLIVLLRKNDALDKALRVRPLNEWVS